jgi:alkylation response protein AidB-like acyl-CoA dehydrogenase
MYQMEVLMEFDWTREQKESYQRIMSSAQQNLRSSPISTDSYWTRRQWQRCGELGILGLSVPRQYQGQGLDALTTAYMMEAFGRGCEDMGLVFSSAAHLFACCMPISEYGNEQARERFLPGLCTGLFVGANAITEEEAGSDVFSMQTHAERDSDTYVLTGAKNYVSNGPVADVFVVYAVTKREHGYFGISGFIVERDTPGLIIHEPFQKMGLLSTPGCRITLNACRVPGAYMLGEEGQGAPIFTHSMRWERACLFAGYVGMMERQLEQTVIYAQKRQQFGKAIGKNQAISHRIADMKLRLEAARLLLYHACWLFVHGKSSQMAISLSKLAISEAAIQNSLDAIQIHGSTGFGREHGIERMLRDSIPGAIFSGTSEMQREIIAGELGL